MEQPRADYTLTAIAYQVFGGDLESLSNERATEKLDLLIFDPARLRRQFFRLGTQPVSS